MLTEQTQRSPEKKREKSLILILLKNNICKSFCVNTVSSKQNKTKPIA
jgi:hypothetical protein